MTGPFLAFSGGDPPRAHRRSRRSAAGFLAAAAAGAAGALAFAAGAAAGAGPGVLHVDDGAAPGGDGGSWATAFAHLSDAVLAANADPLIAEIRVGPGTYRPDSSDAVPGGTGDRDAVFALRPGLQLVGGYAGPGAPDPDLRDVDLFIATLTGDLLGNDDPDDEESRADNSRGLIVLAGEPGDAWTLDGLAFTAVEAVGTLLDPATGAVEILGGQLTVASSHFHGNRLRFDSGDGEGDGGGSEGDPDFLPAASGAGLHARGADVLVTDSRFVENRARRGGGIFIQSGSLTARFCLFDGNRTIVGGGFDGTFVESLVIEDSVFVDNWADVGAAGEVRASGPSVRFERCVIRQNTARVGAPVFSLEVVGGAPWTTFEIRSCVIEDNTSDVVAAGITLQSGPQEMLIVRDTVFRRNTAPAQGPALFMNAAWLDIANSVFDRNTALSGGAILSGGEGIITQTTFHANGGGLGSFSNVAVRNSIFHDNDPGGGSADVQYSLVQAPSIGEGNLVGDPLFVQPSSGNLRLSVGSPAIDLGNPAFVPPRLDLDLAGEPRIQGASVDAGAYEGGFEPLPPAIDFPDIDPGEPVISGLDGGMFMPLEGPAVIFINESDVEDAGLLIQDVDAASFPPAPGGDPVGFVRQVVTDVPEGSMRLLLLLHVDLAELQAIGGPDVDPLRVNLARRDEATGAWALAASANTVAAPGVPTTLGDRIVAVDTPGIGFFNIPGQWGIWWNSAEQRGVVWATTDRSGDYGIVLGSCPADAAQPPDGSVDLRDLLEVLGSFGRGAGPWDVDGDGSTDLTDLTGILAAWGRCP